MNKITKSQSEIMVRARHESGMTQKDVAKAFGVSQQTVRRWEHVALPPLVILVLLEDVYDEVIIEKLAEVIRIEQKSYRGQR